MDLTRLALNLLACTVVFALAPGIKGVITRLEHIVQSKRGPSIFQPYSDFAKLLRKGRAVSQHASWLFTLTPYVVFAAPLVVALLIPVLTAFPLFWAFTGDMMGGGMVLALAGFLTALAALDTASPYGGVGSSRSRFVSLLAEPVLILVFFAVSYIAQATIPFIVNRSLTSTALILSPSHILLVVAFFMVLLAEGGRLPVDNPTSHNELSMIEASRITEYSGPDLALMEWGGAMKQLVLMTILVNVLIVPWGLAPNPSLAAVAVALVTYVIKLLFVAVAIVAVEMSLAKLRLLRIAEFLGAAFVTSLLALITYTVGG